LATTFVAVVRRLAEVVARLAPARN